MKQAVIVPGVAAPKIVRMIANAFIYRFDAAGIERIADEDTEHFQVTRDFLANPARMLKQLLAP